MRSIFYVTSEATPFAASGGLGDVMGALPRTVRRLLGRECTVTVALPLYGTITKEWRQRMRCVHRGELSLAWRRVPYAVHRLSYYGVEYLFIENPRYFSRPALYGEFDDGERFAFFARATVEYVRATGRIPDVWHANDWQSALSIVYLRTLFAEDPALFSVRTVFTIHNVEYQGRYDPAILSDVFDLHPVHRGIVEYGGCLNLMKGAITLCDRLTTVSPRYAGELTEEEHSCGLSPVIRAASWKLSGILNGLDTAYFSPADPSCVPYPYDKETVAEGKRQNKAALARELSLPIGEAPLFVAITRLTEAKGLDILLPAVEALLGEGARFVLLGTGEPRYEHLFRELCRRYPEKARAVFSFDRALSKRLYAAGDVFLMPSRSEPCGLAQMTACRYGCVPVVRAVGGLADSITPYGEHGGNGFVFHEYSPEALESSLFEALALYRTDPAAWARLRRTCLLTDFSWRRSAAKYIELYESITHARG
ncbi:MAG: glycogen synthase [Clostridia bacterium]|nr:glycogen synthase [Clostridia bacterium]